MFTDVGDEDFVIVSVAMDADIEAARPWVAEADDDSVSTGFPARRDRPASPPREPPKLLILNHL